MPSEPIAKRASPETCGSVSVDRFGGDQPGINQVSPIYCSSGSQLLGFAAVQEVVRSTEEQGGAPDWVALVLGLVARAVLCDERHIYRDFPDALSASKGGTEVPMPSSTGDADLQRVPQPTRDGQGPGGSPLHRRPGDLADGPRWLLDKGGKEDWGTAEWLRWERLRTRFVYLRVEPRYSDQAGGFVSCSWLDDDVVGLPTISSTLRSGNPFPTLDALTQLMEAVAAAREHQVRDSLDNTE